MVHRIVFHEHFRNAQLARQILRVHKGGETGIETGLRVLDGQQLAVAPERFRTGLDQLAADGVTDCGVVVGHFQRPEAFADPGRRSLVTLPAHRTRQSRYELHYALPRADAAASATRFDPSGSAFDAPS